MIKSIVIDPEAHETGHAPVGDRERFIWQVTQPSGHVFEMRASQWIMDTLYAPTGATFRKLRPA